ncbi:hypothetical protein, partial [Mycobacterium sp. DL99]|uniref:hypothetical protein n=1 Tax=Mycobacterium sp. DL99 TaxID=2528957 RepID=UPI001AEC31D5
PRCDPRPSVDHRVRHLARGVVVIRALAAGTALGLGVFTVAFLAFMRGWLGVDGILIDTLHHF